MKEYTRNILSNEKKRARFSHLKIILALLVCGFICFVVYKSGLQQVFKNVTYIFLPLVVLIFGKSQFSVEKDVKSGEVTVYEGIIIQKFKMGGKKTTGGILSKSKGRTRTTTYFLRMEGKKLRVSARIYKKAKEGMNARISVLPKSDYVISIENIA